MGVNNGEGAELEGKEEVKAIKVESSKGNLSEAGAAAKRQHEEYIEEDAAESKYVSKKTKIPDKEEREGESVIGEDCDSVRGQKIPEGSDARESFNPTGDYSDSDTLTPENNNIQAEMQPGINMENDKEEKEVITVEDESDNEDEPLTLRLTSLTVGEVTRVYEVAISSALIPIISFKDKAKYIDMRYFGGLRENVIEGNLLEGLYLWLRKNAKSKKPQLRISTNSSSLALLHQKIKQYKGEHKAWGWLETVFVNMEDKKKNWRYFAHLKEVAKYRGNKPNHETVELCDHFRSVITTCTLDLLEAVKIKMYEKGGDMVLGGSRRVLPEGRWNLINEGRHAICNKCGQVQRTTRLGKHMEREHDRKENMERRRCQICNDYCGISDLKSHTSEHATVHYPLFWVINKETGLVICPECEVLRHLNGFNLVSHMKEKHKWSEFGRQEAPLCFICEERVALANLNKHILCHSLTHSLLDLKTEQN